MHLIRVPLQNQNTRPNIPTAPIFICINHWRGHTSSIAPAIIARLVVPLALFTGSKLPHSYRPIRRGRCQSHLPWQHTYSINPFGVAFQKTRHTHTFLLFVVVKKRGFHFVTLLASRTGVETRICRLLCINEICIQVRAANNKQISRQTTNVK